MSTRDQADNGHSPAAQRAKIEAYATLHDLELSDRGRGPIRQEPGRGERYLSACRIARAESVDLLSTPRFTQGRGARFPGQDGTPRAVYSVSRAGSDGVSG